MTSSPPPAGGIRIVPVGPLDAGIVEALHEPLRDRFGRTVRTAPTLGLPDTWYHGDRDQYHGDLILDALIGRRSPADWSLGIIDHDLYVPGLSFVFGQATVSGCCALIGLARLEDATTPRDSPRFFRRVLTEAVHELGHVAGLEHCADPTCVMYFSTRIEDTDRKGTHFCGRCAAVNRVPRRSSP